MKRSGADTLSAVLKWLCRFVSFFALTAFVTTCCLMLFFTVLSDTMGFVLTAEELNIAAKLTFFNVVLISLLFTLIDAVRRRLTVIRPARQITDAADKIMQGDYSVRVKLPSAPVTDGAFLEIADSFNKMAEELGSVEALRDGFVADASHEMKTPLAVIGNYAALLGADSLSDEKRIEYATGIMRASERTADMITNILKLNKLENRQIFPSASRYELAEQLCECLLAFESVWEDKCINIETELEEGVGINEDRELLALVWNNLFSNAFKFTPEGGTVSVSLRSEGDRVVVSVADTGCGMSPETGARIFDKFYQGDTSHSSKGNGLGLALVKRVIDIVGGEIRVSSRLGEGSEFTVILRRK